MVTAAKQLKNYIFQNLTHFLADFALVSGAYEIYNSYCSPLPKDASYRI
jgi:hypothetical protein